mmetsp:Transcript_17011/g.33142  ORF Transcript_17011/g.33142 Transcript_17011/m.33142 type:complete len:93 (-) Transcript_17011:64-342(-)
MTLLSLTLFSSMEDNEKDESIDERKSCISRFNCLFFARSLRSITLDLWSALDMVDVALYVIVESVLSYFVLLPTTWRRLGVAPYYSQSVSPD